jgi:hypothetical protein
MSAMAFSSVTDMDTYNEAEALCENLSTEMVSCYFESNLYGVDECLPHSTPQSSVSRSQKVARKTHRPFKTFKSSFGFAEVIKLTTTGTGNFIQKQSLIIHSSFINPDHRLYRLGKLII